MLAKTISKVAFFCSMALFLLLPVLSIVIHHEIKYDWLITYILHEINRSDLYEIVTKTYFPLEKFLLLKTALYCLSAIAAAVFLLFLKYRKNVLFFIENSMKALLTLIRNFKNALIQNSRLVNILLSLSLILILGRSLYYAAVFYIQYDEAWNYNYFLHKNIIYSFFAYNNYPLHNIISWLFVKILPANTLVLRIPSIVIGLFTCTLVFVTMKKIFKSEWLALSSMLIFSCLPVSVFYMLYARGVVFEMFFAILICYLLIQYLQEKVSVRKIIFLAILNALGTYSMLSHGYFIVLSSIATVIFLLFQKEKQFRFIILYPLLSVLFSGLLLSPMLLGTGVSLGLNAGNADASYLVLHYLPFHCYADFMTGGWFIFYLLLVVNTLFIFFSKAREYTFIIILNLVFLFSPFIIKYTTGVYPPERALAFLAFVPISTFCMFASYLNIKIKLYFPLTLIVILVLSYTVHYHPKLNWSKQLDQEVYILSSVLKTSNVKSVYSENDRFNYFVPGVQYYYHIDKKEIYYSTSDKSSTRYSEKKNTNADCIVSSIVLPDKKLIYSYDSIYVYYLK